MKPKVLMIGWELPPHNSGGLGIACMGLTKALASKGVDITFVLPKKVDLNISHMKVVFADIKEIEKLKSSYTTSSHFKEFEHLKQPSLDFVNAALAFGEKIKDVAKKTDSDLIHSHDWLTFPAGIAAKKILTKPLITHVHATEFDRTGGHYPNPYVYAIEREGLITADKVISVSEYTKKKIMEKYAIEGSKINVVHNGVEGLNDKVFTPGLNELKKLGYKIVLYLGRITLQKGPEYFVWSAKKVLEFNPKVLFVVVGTGDMQEYMMNEAAKLGILDKFLFTGFLRGNEKHRIYQDADLYVMPSVSEPFGITALESISNRTPILISKQSGVSEVVNHALKVDFWDTDEMANKILGVLKYPPLSIDLKNESIKELPNINWDSAADKCISLYKRL